LGKPYQYDLAIKIHKCPTICKLYKSQVHKFLSYFALGIHTTCLSRRSYFETFSYNYSSLRLRSRPWQKSNKVNPTDWDLIWKHPLFSSHLEHNLLRRFLDNFVDSFNIVNHPKHVPSINNFCSAVNWLLIDATYFVPPKCLKCICKEN